MKIGRNEACFCGSGKKFKRCCMTKSKEVQEANAEACREKDRKNINKIFLDIIDQDTDGDVVEALHAKIKHFNNSYSWDVYPGHPLYELMYDFDAPLSSIIEEAKKNELRDYYEVVEPLYNSWRNLKGEMKKM